MKHPSTLLRTLSMKLSLVIAVTGVTLAACASDEVLGFESLPDAAGDDGGSVVPEGGTPAPKCGDGSLDPGEECDDGNTKSGDGCSASCMKESKAASSCPGVILPLTATGDARIGSISGNTSTALATLDSPTCGGGNGKELVYLVKSDVAGRAVVRLRAQWAALLYVRKDCTAPTTETECKTLPAGGGSSEVALPVTPGDSFYVIVDGAGGQSGEFQLDVSISTAFCGDGIATYPEQCEDGNTVSGDGCSASCQLEAGNPGVGACPGIAYTFVGDPNGPRTISLAGDVSLLSNTMSATACSSVAGGKDQAYAITPTIDGALTAVLHAAWPEAAFHVRRECFSSSTEVQCRMDPTGPVRMTFPVSANQTYTLFVDSKTGASFPTGGLYSLDLTLSPTTCGNGIFEAPEECEDGNTTDGDGCSATCTLEPMPAGIDTCTIVVPAGDGGTVEAPGGALIAFAGDAVNGPLTFHAYASTVPLTAAARTCASGTSARKDAIYRFVAPFNGYMTARAKGEFNLTLDLRENCLAQSSSTSTGSLSCGNADQGNGPEVVRGPVAAGKTYYVIVDGPSSAANAEGPFALDVELEKAVCGNGRMEGGEACDDGNNVDGDTCSATCTIEPLGSPTRDTCAEAEELVLPLDEVTGAYTTQVKGGNWNLTSGGSLDFPCGATVGRDAFFKFEAPIDGVVQVKVDATYNVTPALRDACPPNTGSAFLICSNRTTLPGGEFFTYPVKKGKTYWIIVDAAHATNDRGAFTMDVAVKGEDCGDGVVGGTEECDDGNTTAGDGCNATCKLEPLAGADTCPGHAVALTGVGMNVRSAVVTLSTATLSANTSGTCGGNAREGVVAITSDVTGTMRAELRGIWPTVLYAREKCTDGASELGCNAYNPTRPHRTERELSFQVFAGVPTYLFIDGLGGATGPGSLFVTVTP